MIDYVMATEILIIVVTIIIVVYDIFAAVNFMAKDATKNGTISARIRLRSLRWSFVASAWGTLGGHFFSPFEFRTPVWITLILLLWGIILLCANAVHRLGVRSHKAQFVVFVVHIGIGALCWSQGDMSTHASHTSKGVIEP